MTLIRLALLTAIAIAFCSAAEKQIHHMVMFTWKEGTTQEQADAIAKALT